MKTDIDRHFKDKGMLMFVDQQVPDMMSIASSFYAMGGMVQGIDPQHFTNDFLRDADADAIVVRSATRVDEALLAGTKVQFVGSTTAGADHLDRAWMEHYGIKCAHCPGANAAAVADYVLSAMARLRPSWRAGPLGIIGCGHTGSLLARRLMRLGTPIVCHDPLVERIANVGRLLHRWHAAGTPETAAAMSAAEPALLAGAAHGPQPQPPSAQPPSGWRLLPQGGLLINSARGDCMDGAMRCLAAPRSVPWPWMYGPASRTRTRAPGGRGAAGHPAHSRIFAAQHQGHGQRPFWRCALCDTFPPAAAALPPAQACAAQTALQIGGRRRPQRHPRRILPLGRCADDRTRRALAAGAPPAAQTPGVCRPPHPRKGHPLQSELQGPWIRRIAVKGFF